MTEGRGRLPPDAAQLVAAVREAFELGRKAHARVILVGTLAMQHYGSDRLSYEVEVAATAPLPFANKGAALPFGGYVATAANGVPVDVILRDDEYKALYEDALARAKGDVVSAEHLAAMKMAAMRAKDTLDLDWLIATEILDLADTERIICSFLGPYAARKLKERVAEVRWRRDRKEP